MDSDDPRRRPPEAWPVASRAAARILGPIGRFLQVQAASGIVLLGVALLALAWANSPWIASYERLLHTPVTLGLGRWVFRQDLHFVVNEVLMTIFFFLVGLEIRRELHEGELSTPARAAVPAIAALGGMVAPALLYLACGQTAATRGGWGVPMATDIAFAVGVLALLGPRVPPALRVLLLALAVIDDLGAILIIAFFYSDGIEPGGLFLAALGGVGILGLQRLGVRRAAAYVVPALVVWGGMWRAGVHPTIAGVVVGMLTPVRAWFGRGGFTAEADAALAELRREGEHDDAALVPHLARIGLARREAIAPVVRIQAALHPWVAFGIMPLFAFPTPGWRSEMRPSTSPRACRSSRASSWGSSSASPSASRSRRCSP